MLGSTDILGNPAGLVNNLGRGVAELYSEPLEGILEGDAGQAVKGVARGVKGLVSHSAFGVSNSVSRMSGTLYLGLKHLSGH